jgi:hypothetical protein
MHPTKTIISMDRSLFCDGQRQQGKIGQDNGRKAITFGCWKRKTFKAGSCRLGDRLAAVLVQASMLF